MRGLGKASGLHYSWLSKLESGRDPEVLSVSSLAGLSKALDIPISRLLVASGFDSDLVLPEFEEFLRLRYPKLGSARRRALLAAFRPPARASS